MLALVVSDIHGNVHALEAVLAAARNAGFVAGTDEFWNLGDMVGYGARPNEVLALLRPLATVNVRGNHDRVCCGLTSARGFNPVAAAAAAWTERKLTPDNREWLRAVPKGPIAGSARTLCAHGSPLHEDHYIIAMRDAWLPLQRMAAEITFFGHTHVQGGFSRNAEQWEEILPALEGRGAEAVAFHLPDASRQLINPGSVGQPRDRDPRAAFAIYTEEAGGARTLTYHRVPYDIDAAQAAIREAHLPDRLASRLAAGK